MVHPALVPLAREVFDAVLGKRSHQKDLTREIVSVAATALADIQVPGGTFSEAVIRSNTSVALQYINVWLEGTGAVAINNLMEDAATAEIARAQLWQWIWRGATLEDGRVVTPDLYIAIRAEELTALRGEQQASYRKAASLLDDLVLREELVEFLTLPAYERLIA